jgi:hypothetical protein
VVARTRALAFRLADLHDFASDVREPLVNVVFVPWLNQSLAMTAYKREHPLLHLLVRLKYL